MINFAVVRSQGRSHEKKAAALLDFVKITPPPPPPILITCTTFFRRQNSKFESQFRTRNTIYRVFFLTPPPPPSLNMLSVGRTVEKI